jgi:hypothetical protein
MTYQAKAPKKAYFTAGYDAGFNDALEAFWFACSRCGNEEMVSSNNVYTQEDIDAAWNDYCDYWKQKAMEEE